MCRVMNQSAASKGSLRVTSGGVLALYDTANALVSTGTTVLSANTWYRIDLSFGTETGAANNDAAYEVKIDGVSEFSGTGNFSDSNNASLRLGKAQNLNSQTVDFYYRNMRSSTTGFAPAGSRQRVMLASGAGNYSGATSGTYADVDEVPHDGNTSYLGFVSNTNRHSVALESSSSAGVSGTISGVMPFGVGVDAGAGGVNLKAFLRSGGADTDSGTGVDQAGSYDVFGMTVFETDPADAAAWTTAKLDALEVGCYLSGSSAVEQRVTLLGVVVEFVPAAPPDGNRRRRILTRTV
jgi:hypothetical protein